MISDEHSLAVRIANAIRPKLSAAARERIEELIYAEYAMNVSHLATDIQFLLDYHDKVHAAAE